MREGTTTTVAFPSESAQDVLSEVLRDGAQRMLALAIEAEVAGWIERHADLKDENSRRQVVRNGYLPERTITTGLGDVKIQQPRIRDRRPEGERERFTSKILPPHLRKTKSIEELIPWQAQLRATHPLFIAGHDPPGSPPLPAWDPSWPAVASFPPGWAPRPASPPAATWGHWCNCRRVVGAVRYDGSAHFVS